LTLSSHPDRRAALVLAFVIRSEFRALAPEVRFLGVCL